MKKETKQKKKKKKRTRKRNIIWFNPPPPPPIQCKCHHQHRKNVFFELHMCFPTNNKLHKILNKNTVKLSYSCMQNRKIISTTTKQGKTCNCRDKKSYPLKGQCLLKVVVYRATIEQKPSKKQDNYIGITENDFKTRYNQHTSSF